MIEESVTLRHKQTYNNTATLKKFYLELQLAYIGSEFMSEDPRNAKMKKEKSLVKYKGCFRLRKQEEVLSFILGS